jgi:hypothetical protein
MTIDEKRNNKKGGHGVPPPTNLISPTITSACNLLTKELFMKRRVLNRRWLVFVPAQFVLLTVIVSSDALTPLSLTRPLIKGLASGAQNPTPSDTVREFYKAMRERRFRDAFALSIYKSVIDGLSDKEFQELRPSFKDLSDEQFAALRSKYQKLTPAEFDDLKPDFERLATAIPEKVDISGEQISGDAATVFVRVKEDDKPEQAEPITLIRVDGRWIVGDKENQQIVRKAGKEFFFNARIDTHHNEVQDILKRIALAQLVYSQQNNGQFGDMAALIAKGLIPKDLEGTETTGYRFHINVTADKKSWTAAAEPAQYGRTGRLSFFMDATGVRSGDAAGKPLPMPVNQP